MRLIFSNGTPFAVSSVDQFFLYSLVVKYILALTCESLRCIIIDCFECSLWIASPVCLIAMYRNAKKLLKLFVLLLFLFTSHIVKVHTFLYKIGQSRDTLTADKTCMQTRKDRREYMWNCCKQGDHPGNNASTYCFACLSNASDTGIRTNRNKSIHTRSDFI